MIAVQGTAIRKYSQPPTHPHYHTLILNSEIKLCKFIHLFNFSIGFSCCHFSKWNIFGFLTPNKDSLTPKTQEKSQNNIEIWQNMTFSAEVCLHVWRCCQFFKHSLCSFAAFPGTFLKFLEKTRICSTGLETGCIPVLFNFGRIKSSKNQN